MLNKELYELVTSISDPCETLLFYQRLFALQRRSRVQTCPEKHLCQANGSHGPFCSTKKRSNIGPLNYTVMILYTYFFIDLHIIHGDCKTYFFCCKYNNSDIKLYLFLFYPFYKKRQTECARSICMVHISNGFDEYVQCDYNLYVRCTGHAS